MEATPKSTAIAALPNEIWSLVFSFLVPIIIQVPIKSPLEFPWLCLWVCTRWRQIILENRQMWGSVYLSLTEQDVKTHSSAREMPESNSPSKSEPKNGRNDRSPDLREDNREYHALQVFGEIIQRSYPRSLLLVLEFAPDCYPQFPRDLLRVVSPHSQRIQALLVKTCFESFQYPPQGHISLPNLLALCLYNTSHLPCQADALPILEAPKLLMLSADFALPSQFVAGATPHHALQHLKVAETKLPAQQILTLLGQCPRLQTLDVFSGEDIPEEAYEVVAGELLELSIQRSTHLVGFSWGKQLECPRLSSYSIKSTDNWVEYQTSMHVGTPKLEQLKHLTLDIFLPASALETILESSTSLVSLRVLKGLPFTHKILRRLAKDLAPVLTTLECVVDVWEQPSPPHHSYQGPGTMVYPTEYPGFQDEGPFFQLHAHLAMIVARANDDHLHAIRNFHIIQSFEPNSPITELYHSTRLLDVFKSGCNITIAGEVLDRYVTVER